MATGHVLPAQKQAVSNLYRVHAEQRAAQTPAGGDNGLIRQQPRPSFLPENNNRRWLLTQAPVDSDRLEAIRRQARDLWGSQQQQQQPASHTSYQRHYSAKQLDEPTRLRPTSPDRRNNPHPPIVFLTCRLHNVPGFSNADSSTDKATYKMDGSQSAAVAAARQRQRSKFVDRPDNAALRQYSEDKDPLEEAFGRKLDFRVSSLGRRNDEDDEDFVQARKRMTDWQQSARPSLHRYLKYQGPVERDRLECRGRSGGWQHPRHPQRQQRQQQQQELRSAPAPPPPRDTHPRGLVYQPTRARGDYLIHPMWPPTLPHHSVP